MDFKYMFIYGNIFNQTKLKLIWARKFLIKILFF